MLRVLMSVVVVAFALSDSVLANTDTVAGTPPDNVARTEASGPAGTAPDEVPPFATSLLAALNAQPERPIADILEAQGLSERQPSPHHVALTIPTGELVILVSVSQGRRMMVLSGPSLAMDLTLTADDILVHSLDEAVAYEMAVRHEEVYGPNVVQGDFPLAAVFGGYLAVAAAEDLADALEESLAVAAAEELADALEAEPVPVGDGATRSATAASQNVSCVSPNDHTFVCSYTREDGAIRGQVFRCCVGNGSSCSGGSDCTWRIVLDTGWMTTPPPS